MSGSAPPARLPGVDRRRAVSSLLASAAAAAAGHVWAQGAYRLGPGDRVRVTVFGESQLSGEFQVSDDGEIGMPLVGAVKAEGLDVRALEQLLHDRLAQDFLRNPRVSAEVETYRPFYILGEVQKPGAYPYSTGLTVLNAVATAGGFSYRANTRTVVIRRAGADAAVAIRLTPTTAVGPGDTVLVKERFF
jgi:protein involved in polysaccharide export with SLBB domain